MYRAIFSCLAAAALIVTTANSVPAMTDNGCAGGACTDCHSLSRQEAVRILGNNVDNVQSIDMSPVKGLWEVAVEKDGKRWPLYIDFSKEYVVAGHIVQVSTKENLTGSRMLSMNRIDVSQIPLGGSILLGKMDAKHRIVVFDDPGCTYCARLHETAKGLPAGKCDGRSLDETIQVAKRLNIRTTPTLVFPDGRVVAGAIGADAILSHLKESKAPPNPKGDSR